ncbi:GNAT family N-acetyltransferase [Metabacillus litoralis]|uniref:GNAT family N-acetyltransferase n=1 Tax=Metabacillus litoralis TaxID=152268 RepID=UPI001BA03901|nr:GNAT family N-acetyltransferase [Metabacillus litoralis]MCM3162512.1 GNAT family N-acetyltransferase [Metabacillus litoralis]UHA61182.1 GNAT family N-acetyltransferase [Metabacillus litoralis]
MKIRKATQNETNSLLHMTINTMNESSMGTVKNDFHTGMNMFVPLLNSGAYYLIALDKQTIAGWVLLGPDFNPMNTRKTGSIIALYVFPQYRKAGIGKQLMNKAMQELKSEGYHKVQLNVFTGNPAKSLYKRLGFKEISSIMEMDIN